MSSNVDTSGYQRDRYFSRSWALLTQEKGWWKPVLICAAASLVPVVGPLAVLGYALEWSRRIAWGSTDGPARSVKVGDLIRSGWRGLVVIAGWTIAQFLINYVLGKVPYFGDLLSFVWGIVGLLLGMAIMVAAVRATIYQDFKAGYRAETLYKMVSEDPWGLMRIWLIELAVYVIDFVVGIAIFIPTVISSMSWIIRLVDLLNNYGYGYYDYYGYGGETAYALDIIGAIVGHFAPAILFFAAIALVTSVFVKLLMYAGVGLWMRRFDVDRWGRDEDPLPDRVITRRAETPAAPAAPTAPAEPVAPAAPVVTVDSTEPGMLVKHAQKPAEDGKPEAPVTETVEEPAVKEEESPIPGDDLDEEADESGEDGANDPSDDELISIEPIAVAPIEVPTAPDSTNSDTPSY